MTELNLLLKKIPDYAEDIKTNLTEIFLNQQNFLTKEQLFGIAIAVCYKLKYNALLSSIKSEARMFLDKIDINSCKNAAIMMEMTNTYHKFGEAVLNEECKKEPMNLEIPSVKEPKIDHSTFHMYCLAVSILNGCHYCINVFTKKLQDAGYNKDTICQIARIAAVLKATKTALKIDSLYNCELFIRDECI